MDTGNDWLIMLAIIIVLFFQSMTYSPYSALMTELFPTHVRYTSLSLCYLIAPILAGSWAPLISLYLLDKFHSSIPIVLYLVAASVISIVSISLVKETKGQDLAKYDE